LGEKRDDINEKEKKRGERKGKRKFKKSWKRQQGRERNTKKNIRNPLKEECNTKRQRGKGTEMRDTTKPEKEDGERNSRKRSRAKMGNTRSRRKYHRKTR